MAANIITADIIAQFIEKTPTFVSGQWLDYWAKIFGPVPSVQCPVPSDQ